MCIILIILTVECLSKMVNVPTIKFNNERKIPILGLGTYKSNPGEVIEAVEYAIDIGYRHIDCAYLYENEDEIGIAIKNKIAEGVVKREDLFVTSKLWNTFHRPEIVESAFMESLNNLKLEYLDLYLLHNPFGYKEGPDLFPMGPNGCEFTDYDYVDTWKEIEKLCEKGLVKSIGISNFNKSQTERLLKNCKVCPVTNQVECHPYLNQKKLMQFSKSRNIEITAYSTLGSRERPWAKPGDLDVLSDSKLIDIAKRLNKSLPQILLRYQIQRGNIAIVKSTNKKRILENFQIFNFELSSEDIAYIDSFDCNGRLFAFDGAKNHKYYAFNEEY